MPLPTEANPRQNMTPQQILLWGAIIAIVSTIGLVAALALTDGFARIVGGQS